MEITERGLIAGTTLMIKRDSEMWRAIASDVLAKRDEHLELWRWPGDPHYAVTPDHHQGEGYVRLLVEHEHRYMLVNINRLPTLWDDPKAQAAVLAYADEHRTPLPSTPGIYLSGDASTARVGGTLRLHVDGRWAWVGNEYTTSPEVLDADAVRMHMPLVRLVAEIENTEKGHS